MDFGGSGTGMSDPLWRPAPPCAAAGLDPPNIKISDSGGLDLEAWCLDAGCWKDWNGLEEVTEVTAFWGEGIGRNSHTLKLQELGGFLGLASEVVSRAPNPCGLEGSGRF